MGEKLYHISNNVEIIKEFIPRIPSSKADWEDEINQRVCLSNSIEGCLSAVPWGALNLSEMFVGCLDSSYLLRVYEFDVDSINEEDLIGSDILYEEDLVSDAGSTGECWFIGNKLIPCKTYLIELSDFIEDVEDIYSYQDEQYILENEDTITTKEIDSMLKYSMSIIKEAVYSVINEDKASKIVESKYRIKKGNITKEELNERLSSLMYSIEDIFGYSAINSIEEADSIMKITTDTRISPINIDRFDELLKDLLLFVDIERIR